MDKDVREIFSAALRIWVVGLLGFLVVGLMCLMCGCSSARYVPVETVRTEYVDKVRVERVTDSVTNDRLVYVKGDTVYIREWRDRWRTQVRTDTVVSVRTDSVAVPCPVERSLTRWEETRMRLGEVMLLAMGAAIVGMVVWLAIVRRRRP